MSERSQRRTIAYMVLVAFTSTLMGTGVSLAVSFRNERKWCELMVVLDEGYNAPVQPGQPPLTERGARIAAAIHGLRQDLNCD